VTQRVGFDNWVPINVIQPGYWEIFLEKDTEIPAFCFHHEKLLNDHRQGGPQELHYRQPNQQLEREMDDLHNLLHPSEQPAQ
jgi:hypothetical protein